MLASTYLILLFLILCIEIFRKKTLKLDFLTLFNLYFILLYPLPGFLLAFDYENAVVPELGSRIYSDNIQTPLAIFAGYFLVLIGFYSPSARTAGKNIIIKARNNNLTFVIYAIFLLVLSSLSIYIYGLQYGDIITTIAKNSMIRVGAVAGGNLVFFFRLTMYSALASYLLYSLIFIKKQHNKAIFAIFICSIIAALTALLMSGARAGFLYYFLNYYYIFIIRSKRATWIFTILLFVGACLFLFYGKVLFFSLSAIPNGLDAVIDLATRTSDISPEFSFYNFAHNFQHTVISLDAAFNKPDNLRWFVDFIHAFVSLLPNRLLDTDEVATIVDYNTNVITGRNDYEIPPGLLAFGIYSLWWPGLIITCLIYGWIGRYLQNILIKHIDDIYWMPCVYVLAAQMWIDFMTCDPVTFVRVDFCYWTGCLLLLFISSKIYCVDRHRLV